MHAQAKDTAIVPERLQASLAAAVAQVNSLLLGKQREVNLAFTTLLAGGHLLVEDLPGLGKTTLARSMAATLALDFQRMQFTSDLLPSDIIGVSIFDPNAREFRFHPGPVFAQLLLADEINRAPPRTQSALLEAMAEHQVTVDGTCHPLPQPFFVLATQNPADLAGTFPLPDSQLDRFLLRVQLGYPDAAAEREMLAGNDRRELIAKVMPQLATADLLALRGRVAGVHASEALIAYVQARLAESRHHKGVRVGLSPRSGLGLLQGGRAHALLTGRRHALPEDVQALFVAAAAHRLVPEAEADSRDALAASILKSVPVD
jgi:MoxR-like ATPase